MASPSSANTGTVGGASIRAVVDTCSGADGKGSSRVLASMYPVTPYLPGREPVELSAVAGYVSSVTTVGDNAYAVVLGRGESALRVVRVSAAGECTVGPAVPLLPRGHGNPFLLGDPLRVVRGADVGVVQPDLSVREERDLAKHQLGGGISGGVSWTVGHRPDGTTSAGWWPLRGPAHVDRTQQY